jgi:hypothetical protein
MEKVYLTPQELEQMGDKNKRPPYPLGDLTPEEIEQLRQSKKEIAERVKELWKKENEKAY